MNGSGAALSLTCTVWGWKPLALCESKGQIQFFRYASPMTSGQWPRWYWLTQGENGSDVAGGSLGSTGTAGRLCAELGSAQAVPGLQGGLSAPVPTQGLWVPGAAQAAASVARGGPGTSRSTPEEHPLGR